MEYKRILSIDGGGIKGVFPASFLTAVEESLPTSIGSYFDLIVGTSTGGIIALGLGIGFTAREILDFYETHGSQIFGGNRLKNWVKHWGLTKYRNDALRAALTKRFGDRLLGESRTRLVVPALDLNKGTVHIYKTSHHEKFAFDYRERVVDVALATSAAPTYLPPYRTSSGITLVDGGVWANNPVGMAVVEAIGVLGWRKEQLRVLSLGCTSIPFEVGIRRKLNLGKLLWANRVADIFMTGQSSGSLGTAHTLVGHDNVVRIDPVMPKGRYDLDKHKAIKELCGLGRSVARESLPKLKGMCFFDEPAKPFQPFRAV